MRRPEGVIQRRYSLIIKATLNKRRWLAADGRELAVYRFRTGGHGCQWPPQHHCRACAKLLSTVCTGNKGEAKHSGTIPMHPFVHSYSTPRPMRMGLFVSCWPCSSQVVFFLERDNCYRRICAPVPKRLKILPPRKRGEKRMKTFGRPFMYRYITYHNDEEEDLWRPARTDVCVELIFAFPSTGSREIQ